MTNLEAEQTVLTGLFLYGSEAYNEVSAMVTNNTFSEENHQIIFNCAEEAFKDNPDCRLDIPLLKLNAAKLGYKGFFDNAEIQSLVKMLKKQECEYKSVLPSAKVVRRLEISRLFQDEVKKIEKDLSKVTGFESVAEILGLVENPVFNLTSLLRDNHDDVALMGKNALSYIEHLMDNPLDMLGLPTGYPIYDATIGGGFRRKTINLIGARTKAGKSFLCDNIGLYMARRGIPVLNLDTEMSKEDHIHRILANMSSVEINDIEKGKMADGDKAKVRMSAKEFEGLPLHHVNVAGKPFEEILSIARRWVQKEVGKTNNVTNDCLVIYDYFKLMENSSLKNLQEYQALGFQATTMHNFSVINDIPIMATIQLNRDGVNKESTEVISQSDRIAWLVSNVSIFKRKSSEEMLDSSRDGNRKMVVLAARHGPGLEEGQYINFNFENKIGRISEGKLSEDQETPSNRGFEVDEIPADL